MATGPRWGVALATPVAAAALVALAAGPATAVWAVSGPGPGRGQATALATPTGVTAACASVTTVKIDWTTTATATTYAVEQQTVGQTTWTAVSTVAAPPLVTSAPGLLSVGIRYRVTGLVQGWTSTPSSPSNAITLNLAGLCV